MALSEGRGAACQNLDAFYKTYLQSPAHCTTQEHPQPEPPMKPPHNQAEHVPKPKPESPLSTTSPHRSCLLGLTYTQPGTVGFHMVPLPLKDLAQVSKSLDPNNNPQTTSLLGFRILIFMCMYIYIYMPLKIVQYPGFLLVAGKHR